MRLIGALLALVSVLVWSNTATALTATASPTTCITVAGANIDWTNMGNAVSSNDVYTTVSLGDLQVSDYLQCTGYGFTIPAGATINGITVNVERRSSNTGIQDFAMRLVKAGVIGTTDRSTTTAYPLTDTYEAHGGAADLWGTTWTPADINAANFGAAFASQKPGTAGGARTVSVDHVEIIVDYTPAPAATIINTYYPGTANVAIGATSISLGASTGAATPIAAGDLVLIMTMQDASIDSTNTATYGDGVAGDPGSGATVGNSGLYEYAVAAGFSGGTLTLTCGTINAYTNAAASGTSGQKKFQVIRVPVYASYTLGAITALGWNGSTGGVLAFDVTGVLTLNSATVSVNGLGFRGGATRTLTGLGSGAYTDYRTLATSPINGSKGEGIAGTPRYVFTAPGTRTDTGVEGYPNGSHARGAPGNAGGGGTDRDPVNNDENSGGGGGANAGAGGIGGIGWCPGFTTTAPYYGCGYAALASAVNPGGGTGGFGGSAVTGLGAARLTLGGGGGGATDNNNTGSGACAAASSGVNGLCPSGAAGGGIVMIRAGSMSGTATINANGSNGDSTVQNDGTGGGGGGGAVMINAGSGMAGVTINVKGGDGGSNLIGSGGTSPHGPGGGGGGGYAITSALTAGCTTSGGANGITWNAGALFGAYGSTPGSSGSCITSLTSAQIPGARIGPVSSCAANHYAISHSGTGVNCQAEPVTITAHDSSHAPVIMSSATTITVSTSTGLGDWSLITGTGVLNNGTANDGVATYQFGAESSVVLGLKHTTPGTVNINVTDGSVTETSGTATAAEDLNLVFAPSGFRFTDGTNPIPIGTQIAGKESNVAPGAQSLYLQAIRTDLNTGACVGVFAPSTTVNIQMASQCNDPVTCLTGQVSITNNSITTAIAGNPNSGVASYTAVPLLFGANSQAPFTFNYSDAGKISLHARYVIPLGGGGPSPDTMLGSSNQFVVRPFAFRISGPGIPGVAGPGGAVFAIAGQDFPVTVTAVAWEAADSDINGNPITGADLSGNAVTPNFGQETIPAGVTVMRTRILPDPGSDGMFTGGTYTGFAAGAKTQNLNWDEVGSITLTANLTGGNYLGSLQNVTGTVSPVGRFRPNHFTVTPGALTNRVVSNCGVLPKTTSTFTYAGEQMAVSFLVTAYNALATPGVTSNYSTAGGFAKLDGTVFANFGFGAVDLADATPPLTATALTLDAALSSSSGTWTAGVGDFTATTAVTRAATPDGPYETFWLGILPVDTDAVTLRTADLNLDTSVPADSNDRAQVISASGSVRFGRLRLQNAYGSELLPLPVPMTVQYWNGTAFITNGADSCTQLNTANIGFANYIPNLAAGETTPTVGSVFSAGVGSLTLFAPGAGNNGSVDLVINLGAAAADEVTCPTLTPNPATTGSDRDYLRGRWCGAAYDKDPTARATFGVYANPSQFIYLREMY